MPHLKKQQCPIRSKNAQANKRDITIHLVSLPCWSHRVHASDVTFVPINKAELRTMSNTKTMLASILFILLYALQR